MNAGVHCLPSHCGNPCAGWGFMTKAEQDGLALDVLCFTWVWLNVIDANEFATNEVWAGYCSSVGLDISLEIIDKCFTLLIRRFGYVELREGFCSLTDAGRAYALGTMGTVEDSEGEEEID
jgi:hypothetical protein